MKAIILTAFAVLVALSSAAIAGNARLPTHQASAPVAWLSADHMSAFDLADPTGAADANAHRYHGGPKSND